MKKQILLYILPLITLLTACDKDETTVNTGAQLVTVSSATGDFFTVKLMAADTLFEGYNPLFLQVNELATGAALTQANIKLKPIMHMVSMMHTAPTEQPAAQVNADGLFGAAVVFVMPSNPDEGWTITMALDAQGHTDTVTLNIPVVRSLSEARKINVVSMIDSAKYFISLVQPTKPIVGLNRLEFTVHTKANMMSFPAVENLTISFEPEMPSMDHGSPNNVNPVHTGNGHYVGKLNFTMTGWWRLNLRLEKEGQLVSDQLYFDVTF